ncbi:type III-A CRISPR-associated protein Csm2 [Rubellimicrobium sp. CFH 75288]|uniref:type III-A CRISPR-associated protein Csm2 n=1 Tax=Rubellimicrobium sp. CFH 75288 TaxID=2697034 RepID=UPI0014121D9D|nr:type III-A CRISPR-associated protein Csm2 [Rubellimicrobium sp. CFH 75288]NAZ37430.1 type III-A CRISPR-associated protein Csm2 [Rubellimicrobium sp. CFH 75288]
MARPQSYFGPDGRTPRPELFDMEAQEEARLWTQPSTKKKDIYEPRIPSSQLRRFFGQVMADRRQLELKGAQARDEEAQLAMVLLKVPTVYTAARDRDDTGKSDRQALADFVAHHARLVKTVADFRAFARHFEAVVAWHKVFEKDCEQADRQSRALESPTRPTGGAPVGKSGYGHQRRR